MLDPRIQDLIDWAAATGRSLPMDMTRILEFEDQGHTVDLITGEVIQHGASDTFILSVIGEAELTVYHVEPLS